MGKNNILYTNKTFDKKLKRINLNVIRLGDYINAKTHIEFQCLIDGYKWCSIPDNIIRGHRGCPKCGGQEKYTNEIFDMLIIDKPFYRIGKYIGRKSNINLKCRKCKHEWFATPQNVLRKNSGCPNCWFKREKFVGDLLKKYFNKDKIFLHVYKVFNGKRFNIDYVLKTNKEIFIEYNGEQHYVPVTFGRISQEKAEQKLLVTKNRDMLLKKNCEQYNISLIVIPYWLKDHEIEDVIKGLL